MIITSWNVRGINDPLKQKMVFKFAKEHDIGIFALIETRVKENNCLKIVNKWKGWLLMENYQHAHNGRLWILIREDLQVQFLSKTSQYIHLLVNVPKGVGWVALTFVYASNDLSERRVLWHDLQTLTVGMRYSWMLMGDFNAIKELEEAKVVGREIVVDQSIREFADFISTSELKDHPYTGCFFTWSNKRQEGFQARKIDRALVNDLWFQRDIASTVEFLSPGISDHSPIMLRFGAKENAGPKPFKFFHFWTEHPEYLKLVERVWMEVQEGNPMAVLYKKLRNLKRHLKDFNRSYFGDVHAKVDALQTQLAQIQTEILESNCMSSEIMEKEIAIRVELLEAMDKEEKLLRQKSRVAWLKAGDQNTSFFHKAVKIRNARTSIRVLYTNSGSKLEDIHQIKAEAVNFYQSLLGEKDASVAGTSATQLSSILKKKISQAQQQLLVSPITEEEIKSALFSMGNDKSPGPDGFTVYFYKHAWRIVHKDFFAAVQHYFSTGELRREVNSTILALVPKKEKADRMKDFRPISCCNVVYKCITKVITNRMKGVLPDVISLNQTAFVQGRRISDNVLLAHELVRNYHRQGITPRCAIKIDLMKAFDSLNWDFILNCLKVMGFPLSFLRWIKGCITSPYFSVAVNGSLCGYFAGQRGLRQGDPLSPYLFVIAMEVFSKLLDTAADEGRIGFHPRCKSIKLTHLCFADDLFLFTNGSKESLVAILEVLNTFYNWSGLKLNPEKSEIFTGGITEEGISILVNSSGFKKGTLPVRYLGLPLVSGKLSTKNCEALTERILKRIRSWSVKHLSYAGRVQLINSVLFSMASYWCIHFILPKKVIKLVQQKCRSFLWKGLEQHIGGGKLGWETLCLPKSDGGLGIKDLTLWNKVCVLKNLWSLLVRSGSLWVAWVAKYLIKDRSIWSLRIPGDCSWNWRKLLQLRTLMSPYIRYCVGPGTNVSFWYDKWLPVGSLINYCTRGLQCFPSIREHATVSSILVDGCWHWPRSSDLQAGLLRDLANAIQLSDRDRVTWTAHKSETFSVASAWKCFSPRSQKMEWRNAIWFEGQFPRSSFISWLCIHNRLSTKDRLMSWRISITAPECEFCSLELETRNHLFFECPITQGIWRSLLDRVGMNKHNVDWNTELCWVSSLRGKKLDIICLKLLWTHYIYCIWRERNARLYRNQVSPPTIIIRRIFSDVKAKLSVLPRFSCKIAHSIIARHMFHHFDTATS